MGWTVRAIQGAAALRLALAVCAPLAVARPLVVTRSLAQRRWHTGTSRPVAHVLWQVDRPNVVHVREPPACEKPVEWVLWTTLPVPTVDEVLRLVEVYGARSSRWLV